MSDRRQVARNLISIVILVLIPVSLYMIAAQPSFTPGMARFRVEQEYSLHLTRVTEVEADLSTEDWNGPQRGGMLTAAQEMRCYFGREGEDYVLIAPIRWKGDALWNQTEYYRLRPAEDLPVVSSLGWWKDELPLVQSEGHRDQLVFGAVLDPDITRVELTYPQSMENRVCTVETTEFYDGMFLLYLGDWQYDHYILSAYDAAGELVYRDTRWGADQGWIEETYIRP